MYGDSVLPRDMSVTESDETTRAEHARCDGCPVDEIDYIDLSDLELDDNDDWLYMPLRCSAKFEIQDLQAWLKAEPELDDNRKRIDTRTFTKTKKRPIRMSFDSIIEGLPPRVTNIWKSQGSDIVNNVGKYLAANEHKESVPPMLEPSAKAAISILSDEKLVKSGQESMEAFLNISQSKGIDSFINLNEPEFSEPLMNVSQPTVLYTSIILPTHDSTFIADDTIINRSIVAPQILHRHSGVEEKLSFNSTDETFLKPTSSNDTTWSNETYPVNPLNDTYLKPVWLDKGLNETYTADEMSSLSPPSLGERKTDALSAWPSTCVTEDSVESLQFNNEESNDVKSNVAHLSPIKSSDATISNECDTREFTTRAIKTDLNVTRDIPVGYLNETKSATVFKEMPTCSRSTSVNSDTFAPDTSGQLRQTLLHSMPKAPTSLRRELLAEIRRSGRLDVTYERISDEPKDAKENIHAVRDDNVPKDDHVPLLENRYSTYRKSVLRSSDRIGSQCGDAAATTASQRGEPSIGRKFYTFTKKTNNFIREKTDENTKNVETARPNVGTFCKPLSKMPKRNAAKMLSKLPQFLQKSNPNLVLTNSSLRGSSSGASALDGEYIKGCSQPNIAQNVEKLLPSKLLFDKLKSGGSVNVHASGFPIKDAIGSTESIESTQSTQSAPDLDDRLSTCSDSSHNSSDRRTMNIKHLMQEESLREDSSAKSNRQILQNTWINETKTDLPSPILKGAIGHKTERNLPLNNYLACSTPIVNPTRSSHASSNEGNPECNVTKTKDGVVMTGKAESPNQAALKVENVTRLKRPTNWGIGSKSSSSVISGIPRPASRIPALRFSRPNTKTAQVDLRKGCT